MLTTFWEEKSGRKGTVGDEKWQSGKVMRERGWMHLFDDYLFVILEALETKAPAALQATQNHKQTKMADQPGNESGRIAEAREALRIFQCEVSIIHWQTQ